MSRLQKFIGALVVLAIVLFLAAPWLLSSSLVKNRIEAQLSQLSGHDVVLAGDSSLSIYPYLGVTYGRLTVGQSGTSSPMMLADSIKARVGLVSALTGNPQLTEVTLVKPRLYLELSKDGQKNWTRQKPLENPPSQSDQALPVETIKIADGTIAYRDYRNESGFEIRDVNGTLAWPGTLSPLTTDLEIKWRGKPVRINASIGGPLELMSGGESTVKFKANSDLLDVAFTGNGGTKSGNTIDGALKVASPDLNQTAKWLNQPIGLASLLKTVELSGTLKADSDKMALADTNLVLGEHKAIGRLQLERSEQNRLFIGGTLAFNTLDFLSFEEFSKMDGTIQSDTVSELLTADVDLRLSAESATSGNVKFENLAATALVTSDTASFDIGQAQALAGTISGTVGLARKNNAELSIKVSMQDVGLDQLSDLIGKNQVKLNGNGNAKFALRIGLPTSKASLGRLNGDGSIESAGGTVEGVDFGRIAANSGGSQPLNSENMFRNSTPYERLNIGFHIANGVMFFKETVLGFSEFESTLQGQADLVSQTLALNGFVSQARTATSGNDDQPAPVTPFFIGGTMQKPLFVGLPQTKRNLPENN